jgi:hypothetical protein
VARYRAELAEQWQLEALADITAWVGFAYWDEVEVHVGQDITALCKVEVSLPSTALTTWKDWPQKLGEHNHP